MVKKRENDTFLPLDFDLNPDHPKIRNTYTLGIDKGVLAIKHNISVKIEEITEV